MKSNIQILNITLLLTILSLTFSQKSLAQCANITVSVDKQDSPCSDNGRIEVIVTGKDIDNGKYTELQYRIFRPGTSDTQIWIKNNVRDNLAAGTYQIDIRGLCQDAGNTYIEVLNAVPNVTLKKSTWQPVNIKVEKTRSAFECIDPKGGGQVRFTNASGGQGPYKLKIISAPLTYKGIKEKIFTSVSSINYSTWQDLPSGTYVFELSESSICSSTARATVNIPMLGSELPDIFYSKAYPAQSIKSYQNDTLAHRAIGINRNSFGGDYPYYLNDLSQKVEYTYYHPIDGIPDPDDPSLIWKRMPNNINGIVLDSLKYTIDEIVADVNKNPRIMYRILTGTCAGTVKTQSIECKVPSMTNNIIFQQCDLRKISFRPWKDYDGLFSYPITWALYKRISDGTYSLVERYPDTLSYNSGSNNYLSTLVSPGSYKYVVTTALGTNYEKSLSLSSNSPATRATTTCFPCGCLNNEEIPYFYFDARGMKHVKLVKVMKSIGNQSFSDIDYNNEPGFTPPTFTEWDRDTDLPSDYVSSNSVTLSFWHKVKNNAFNSTINKNSCNSIDLNVPNVRYNYYYEFTDTCGVTSSRVISGNFYHYIYKSEPQFSITYDCYDSFDLMIPNINELIKKRTRTSGVESSVNAFASIFSGPVGSVPGRDYSTDYIYRTDQSFKLKKPGTYTIRISFNSNNNINTVRDSCDHYYQFTLADVDTSFGLDGDLTAAYRCQNSEVGDGYIKIAVKHGSGGPFRYVLYQKDIVTNKYDSIDSNTTGVFQGWTQKKSDHYKVKVTDNGCPTIRDFEQEISVVDLSAVPIAWLDNYNICVGENIELHALALGVDDNEYKWSFSGDPNWSATGKDITISNAGTQHSGVYTLQVKVPLCNDEIFTGSVNISVGIPELYWSPDAVDGNWFEKTNWLNEDGSSAEGYPSPCTTVHIPGNADHYPNLSTDHYPWINNARPVCDTIIYHYGGETAYPSELSYNIAKIQYNWSYYSDNPVSQSQPTLNQDSHYPGNGTRALPRLLRGSWQMLSAPLKYMTAGDFSLAGKPNTFQRLYNYQDADKQITPGPAGVTYPFAQYNLDLSNLCSAVAIAVAPYKSDHTGAQDQSNLQALHGIIEIPYLYNPTQSASHPLHKYNEATQESAFTRYDVETLQPIPSQTDKITRDKQAYRFVYEQADNTPVTILDGSENIAIYEMPLIKPATGNKIMIGNPLMSHIDFDKLYALNTQGGNDIIEDNYEIIESATGNTLTYQIGATHNTASQYIAPLQAIIIKLKNPNKTQKLRFNLTGSKSVVAYGNSDTDLPKPKTINMNTSPQSWVHIQTHIKDSVTRKTNTDAIRLLIGNTISGNDKIKTPQNEDLAKRANIFLIDSHGTWYQELNTPILRQTTRYPIGILTNLTGEITLEITPGGQYTKIQLEDKHLHKTIDVTKGGQYTFYHRINLFTGRPGMDISRFQLKVTP